MEYGCSASIQSIKCMSRANFSREVFGSDRSSRNANLRSFGSSLPRAVNLHISRPEKSENNQRTIRVDIVFKSNSKRHFVSAIPSMQRLLNREFVEQKLLQKKLKNSMLSPTNFASSQDLLLR